MVSRCWGPQPPGSKKQAGDSTGGTSNVQVSNWANHPITPAALRSCGQANSESRTIRPGRSPEGAPPARPAVCFQTSLSPETFQIRSGFHSGTQGPSPEKPAFSGRTEIRFHSAACTRPHRLVTGCIRRKARTLDHRSNERIGKAALFQLHKVGGIQTVTGGGCLDLVNDQLVA